MSGNVPVPPAASIPGGGQRFPPPLPHDPMQTSFKLDEGYSEETRSQTGSDAVFRSPSGAGETALENTMAALPSWITTLAEADRSELAYTILRTLRTSSMASIVERLHPILHLDPVVFLPPELTFEVFAYLDPPSLLVASTISRSWRDRAVDSRLWRELYAREGWAAEYREVRAFESASPQPPPPPAPRVRAPVKRGNSEAEDASMSPGGLFGGGKRTSTAAPGHESPADEDTRSPMDTRRTPVEAPEDAEMEDVGAQVSAAMAQASPAGPWHLQSRRPSNPHDASMSRRRSGSNAFDRPRSLSGGPPIIPSLSVPVSAGQRKLNWQYLYKQRRRLEANWGAGRFVTFRLPHPDFEHEGHGECVYTIQYYGKYLVSGSRDKSLRVWDLDTRRLVRQPLSGHNGSVLCLQFDPSPDEDIIISGSSDTDVIAWRFSTGEKIKKIRHAHAESVLNLRFDKRYLITCSKDKTIKVWNRKALEAGDREFPSGALGARQGDVFPSHVVSMAGSHALGPEARLAGAGARPAPLPRFSLLMTLHGHNAAVNAIQVHGDQIVSASGDRTIKIWSLQQGLCIMTISGHHKGIACVQFDGRRIVSGSSDNTVKIFDRATGAEVACLQGHQYLVRTVQAGFGDQPGGEEDDRAEARAVDRSFFEASGDGNFPREGGARSSKPRNAGSRDPGQISTVGATLPPGGGGSRWGRIVSGSYDETVIIWKRDAEGKWVVGHRLRQQDHQRREARPQGHGGLAAAAATAAATAAAPPPSQTHTQPQPQAQTHAHPQPSAQALAAAAAAAAGANAAPVGHVPHAPGAQQQPEPPQFPGVQQPLGTLAAQQAQAQQALQAAPNNPHLQMSFGHNVQAQAQAQAQVLAHQQALQHMQAQAQAQLLAHQQAQQHMQALAHQHALAMLGPGTAGVQGGNARVFKLQFDARRVICCSQDPRIMGWDFANGDEGIAEASRFFQGLG